MKKRDPNQNQVLRGFIQLRAILGMCWCYSIQLQRKIGSCLNVNRTKVTASIKGFDYLTRVFVAIAFHLFFELFELFQGFLDPPDLLLGLEGLPLLGGSRAVLGVLGRLEVSKDFNDLGQPTGYYI